jgi:mRNA-degrading endonuclease RelE of RelBE toxin-antitoxin system
MKYEIVLTDSFRRDFKQLFKKYRSLDSDVESLKKELLKNPQLGENLGNNTRKIRLAIASKGKGKSGGARVITCTILVDIVNTDIYLLTIYDKSERDSISEKTIENLKSESGLL